MQIQISWQPTDLDLHCLQRQGIFGFSRTRVNIRAGFVPMGHICRVNREVPLEYVNSECRDQPEHPRSLFGTFDVHLQTRFILYKIAMGSKGSDVTSGTYPFRISFQTHLRLDIYVHQHDDESSFRRLLCNRFILVPGAVTVSLHLYV